MRWLFVLLCILAILAFALCPGSLQEKLFAIAYGLDPQRPSHTYFLAGMQLPLEARKLGMFGGFLITYLSLLAAGHTRAASFPPRRITALLVAFIAVMGLDGLNATFFDLGLPHSYSPDLRLRLGTGLLAGIAMAGLLLPALNGSLWREIRLIPALASGREIGGALLLAAAFFLLVDARPAILYYPIGILGVTGLVVELTLINLIFVLVLARRVGMASGAWDVLPPALAALALTMGELILMSIVRYVTLGDITSLM